MFAASCALTGAASAQAAIHIDTPTAYSATNDLTPRVTFSGAGPDQDVSLEADVYNTGGEVGWATVGTTFTDSEGSGNVVPDAALSSDPNLQVFLRVTDQSTGSDTVGAIYVNVVPSISAGFADGDTVTPADVKFDASGAIADQGVALFIDGHRDSSAVADPDGYAFGVAPSSALAPGPHTAYLRSVDADGVDSSNSAEISFSVSPPAPAFADLRDDDQLNQSQPALIVGGVDPAATAVTVSELGDNDQYTSVGTTGTVSSGGHATVTPATPLTDGTHVLVVTQTVNGVTSVLSDTYQVTVKTSASVLDPIDALGNDARPYFSASNLLTNNFGNDTKLKLYVDGQLAATDENFGGGTDGVQPDLPIADGAHSAYVTTVDDLGHESQTPSNTISFAIDTAAPILPLAVSPADGSTVTTASPKITLHTEAGVRVHLLVDETQDEGDQTADAEGNVTFTLSAALADGTHTLYAWASDAAGNATDVNASKFVVKTAAAAPAAPAAPAAVVAPVAPVTPVIPSVVVVAPTKVSLSSHTLTASKPVKVGFTLAKAGTVKVTLTKVVKGKTVIVATVTVKAKAGKGSYTLHRKVGKATLAKGSYKLSLQSVSGSKKSKPVTQKLTVG